MTVSNQRIFVPGSQTKNWRPWGLDILSVFAHVGAIRWPNLGDFDRWPLPATPELTEIVSGLQAYHRPHTVRGLDDPTRNPCSLGSAMSQMLPSIVCASEVSICCGVWRQPSTAPQLGLKFIRVGP
jgi:hypothetical protein